MATGTIISANPVKVDGGSIFVPPGTTFVTTRFDEFTEGMGFGVGVSTLPNTGLNSIDLVNASAGAVAMQPGDIIAKVTNSLGGITNSGLVTMDKGQTLQEFKRDNASGINTATAIRAGFWHEYSGVFTTAPTSSFDQWGVDFSVVPSGGITSSATQKFRFMAGSQDPSGGRLPGKTCW